MSLPKAHRSVSASAAGVSETVPSVLIMTHSHPRLTRGGAEISAQALFRGLKERGAQSWFMGVAGARSEERLGASLTQPYGPDDYVYHPNAPFDYFKFANPDPKFPRVVEDLVAELRPDIVHAHHFVRFGVEMFSAIRRGSPHTRIVLSLHEYLAICHHHGQMMKAGSLSLCEQESYAACAACFPNISQSDFFLRKRYIQTFFEEVDLFIAPSHFLAGRFRSWGLPAQKLAVLENMPPDRGAERSVVGGTMTFVRMPADRAATGRKARSSLIEAVAKLEMQSALRFGFFGQMSPLKGITLLMDAARRLETMGVNNLVIEIYGDYSIQPLEFQEAVREALAGAGKNIVYHGAYDNADVNRLMSRVDAVIVPSTWWENSPVVIQEAFTNGKPVICSNIGGMAEKVTHGVNGLHFEVNNVRSLTETLAELAKQPQVLATLSAKVLPPLTAGEMLDRHLSLYRKILPRPPHTAKGRTSKQRLQSRICGS